MIQDFKEVAKFQFESAQARLERIITRLWTLCLILVLILLATNGAWLYHESKYSQEEHTIIKQEVDTESGCAFVTDGIHIGDRK